MLILPLHKPLTSATFPWMTLALLLANVFVFVFLQSGDEAAQQRALSAFRSSGLAAIEVPLYLDHLRKHGQHELAGALEQSDARQRDEYALHAIQNDDAFIAALRAGDAIAPGSAEHLRWSQLRERVDAAWNEAFTARHLLRYDEFEPARLFSSMFLHGDAGHLIGNMLFLAFLGLLVEGALGPWLFLAVYLLGGIGGGGLSLVRHLGEPGGALGASGAIAALMGAYCLLWGLRKVRFFWWFFVVFDYVKAPAIVLLPLWLGWELINMRFNAEAGVGFDAHAGGIMAGALLAFAVRRLGWERRAFLDADEHEDRDRDEFARAMLHLGRLELERARPLLESLRARHPNELRVLLPLYRSWRDAPSSAGFHAAARAVLLHPSPRPEDVAQVRGVFEDYLRATRNEPPLTPSDLMVLARRWIAAGSLEDAGRVLGLRAATAAPTDERAQAHFELALALRGRGQEQAGEYRRVLDGITAHFPGTSQAQKAAFLLANA